MVRRLKRGGGEKLSKHTLDSRNNINRCFSVCVFLGFRIFLLKAMSSAISTHIPTSRPTARTFRQSDSCAAERPGAAAKPRPRSETSGFCRLTRKRERPFSVHACGRTHCRIVGVSSAHARCGPLGGSPCYGDPRARCTA